MGSFLSAMGTKWPSKIKSNYGISNDEFKLYDNFRLGPGLDCMIIDLDQVKVPNDRLTYLLSSLRDRRVSRDRVGFRRDEAEEDRLRTLDFDRRR